MRPRPKGLSPEAKKAREPLPVDVLASARFDRVHIGAGSTSVTVDDGGITIEADKIITVRE